MTKQTKKLLKKYNRNEKQFKLVVFVLVPVIFAILGYLDGIIY